MSRWRWALAVAISIAASLAVAWLSQLPTTYARAGDALLRLSWRIDGVRVEACRPRTEQELERLAPHMRTPEVCTRGFVDHALSVRLDGRDVLRETVEPGGARRDRPIYVYYDIPVTPGRHRLAVTFEPLVPEGFEGADGIKSYRFDGDIDVPSEEVALITVDPAGERLVRAGA